MLRSGLLILVLALTCLMTAAWAKTVEMEVFARSADITKDMTEFDLLTLNGIRLAVTAELENTKLDSKLFWEKLEQKKLEPADELKLLRPVFSDLIVAKGVALPKGEQPLKVDKPAEQAPEKTVAEAAGPEKITGSFKADLDVDKLKSLYDQVTNNLEETKNKTFYILADIAIDSSMTWDDLGITRPENFNGVIIDSWKKLAQKDFKNFEAITILEKDFSTRPDYMNSKSVTLKWNSTLKKSSVNDQKKTANFELNAEYVLVNTKSGKILTSFDFPVQKRELDTQNKKSLSSALASLVYNLLLSQSGNIQSALEAQGTAELGHLEFKITSRASLSEVYAVNSLLQEKLKDLKATSTVKSYALNDSVIQVEASGSTDQILDKLSMEGGKFPLNEQKILLFNRADKSFAIIPKDSNN